MLITTHLRSGLCRTSSGAAQRDLRAELSEEDDAQRAQRERQAWVETMERECDPWRGGRHVTMPDGRCLWMTAGQQARLADALGRPPGQRVAQIF